jgi:hypothetical protein
MTDRRREVWEAYRADTIRKYDKETFQAVSGKHKLKELFDNWWKTLAHEPADEVEVQDAADNFHEITRAFLEPLPGSIPVGGDAHMPYLLSYGSMMSVTAYADALPIVLKARTEVLGSKEPLEYAEAVRWLEEMAPGSTGLTVVEVSYRFLVPNGLQLPGLMFSGASGKGDQVLPVLERSRRPSRIAAGAKHSAFTHFRRTVTVRDEKATRVINLANRESEKIQALVVWSDRLANHCVGAMPPGEGGQSPGFEWAVWLILTGVWPRLLDYGILKTTRAGASSYGTGSCKRATPYMQMNIMALDAPPEEVARAYQNLRSALKLGRPGPKLDAESEILCLAALDTKEMDGLGTEDRGKFRDAVLKRFVAKARLHGVVPKRFTGAGAWNRARKVLRRAEKTYARTFPQSGYTVRTPKGPRRLISDEPPLFSREHEANVRLV